jgi:hypothetical protein
VSRQLDARSVRARRLVGGLWRTHWLYWLAPITAMLAAARAYDALRLAQPPRAGAAAAAPVIGVQGPLPERVEPA